MYSYYFVFFLCTAVFRVEENSPNLCPTISSLTRTGMNFWPLCTLKVNPTNSGSIVERLDHVCILMAVLDPDRLRAKAFSTFLRRELSTNGPFHTERGMYN